MINVILDFLLWILNSVITGIQFPTFDFSEIWHTLVDVLYYPVKILGFFGVKIFFTLLNLDWGLTISLGVVKTVLKFVRGGH